MHLKVAICMVLFCFYFAGGVQRSPEQEIYHYKTRVKIDSILIVRLNREHADEIAIKRDSIETLKKYGKEKLEEVNKLKLAIADLKKQSYKSGEFYKTKDFFGILAISLTIIAFGISFLMSALKERKKSHEKLEAQNDIIKGNALALDIKNKEIIDSIQYARRIQEASLPSLIEIRKALPKSFIYYSPKDIISGDFYWISEQAGKVFVATADCTGQGVPGALLSIFGISHLKEIVEKNKVHSPAEILTNLRAAVISNLSKTASGETIKDGMDMSVYMINKLSMQLTYSGANNGLFIIRSGAIIELKPNKHPIGAGPLSNKPFMQEQISLKTGDLIISYTDGYADQFGGPKGKKLKVKNFKELLLKLEKMPDQTAMGKLRQAFESWKGKLEQIDDVCVIGVRV